MPTVSLVATRRRLLAMSAAAAAASYSLLATPGNAQTGVEGAQTWTAVREGQAEVTALGANASAVTYWVNCSDGWWVVTTVDTVIGRGSNAEHHAVVRFDAVLQPGQSQLISVPTKLEESHQVLCIRRVGNRVEVARLTVGAL